uniref:Metallo-beta-lactamase family protein n=1 Tax=uncultured organism TaxID=155900 RepID=M1PR34_9ZZZZ|nr:metallo-beta-lactamase family protein [uncultured organism]
MANNTLTWHGHANFQITTPNSNLIIDPWFEGNPSACTGSDSCGSMDLLLVTHDHADHTGQAVDIARNTGAQVGAIVGTAQKLVQEGVPEEQIINGIGFNIGGTVEFKGINITMVQAFHSSESGAPAGYIITLEDGYCLYHAGDTGIFSSMELFGQLYDIDLAILPTGGIFTMDSRHAALACKLLNCNEVVPMHWGSFPILEQDTSKLQQELEKVGAKTGLRELQPGQSIEIQKG